MLKNCFGLFSKLFEFALYSCGTHFICSGMTQLGGGLTNMSSLAGGQSYSSSGQSYSSSGYSSTDQSYTSTGQAYPSSTVPASVSSDTMQQAYSGLQNYVGKAVVVFDNARTALSNVFKNTIIGLFVCNFLAFYSLKEIT